MNTITAFLHVLLGFLLQLLTLFVNFIISALHLVLQFANTIVGLVS